MRRGAGLTAAAHKRNGLLNREILAFYDNFCSAPKHCALNYFNFGCFYSTCEHVVGISFFEEVSEIIYTINSFHHLIAGRIVISYGILEEKNPSTISGTTTTKNRTKTMRVQMKMGLSMEEGTLTVKSEANKRINDDTKKKRTTRLDHVVQRYFRSFHRLSFSTYSCNCLLCMESEHLLVSSRSFFSLSPIFRFKMSNIT